MEVDKVDGFSDVVGSQSVERDTMHISNLDRLAFIQLSLYIYTVDNKPNIMRH